jgi:hypothetical protein
VKNSSFMVLGISSVDSSILKSCLSSFSILIIINRPKPLKCSLCGEEFKSGEILFIYNEQKQKICLYCLTKKFKPRKDNGNS